MRHTKPRQRANHRPKLIAAVSALALGMTGLGYMVMQSMGQTVADELGCYEGIYQKNTAVLVDVSNPRWDAIQGRALDNYFSQLYDDLAFNERLSVFTTGQGQIASVVRPQFSVCGQASTSDEMFALGQTDVQTGYLKKQKNRLFEKLVKPELETLLSLNPKDSDKQLFQSPLMEMTRAIQRAVTLDDGDRLIVVSDGIQSSESARFCSVKNDLPAFKVFAKRSVYLQRLQPQPLTGVGVEMLILQRFGFGHGGLQYCHSEEELRTFWTSFFKQNGSQEPNFIRIRAGVGA